MLSTGKPTPNVTTDSLASDLDLHPISPVDPAETAVGVSLHIAPTTQRPKEVARPTSSELAAMASRFYREVPLERARLALADPQGEADAVAPISPEHARLVLLEHSLHPPKPARPDGDAGRALLTRLGADLSRSRGRVQCPAHGSRSLSISWKYENGKALIHCFAGCTFDEIRAAL